MHGILDLDHALWDVRTSRPGVVHQSARLIHTTGSTIKVEATQDIWKLTLWRPGMTNGYFMLTGPSQGSVSSGPDLLPRILGYLDRMSHPETLNAIQSMHQGVRTLIILSGWQGEVFLTRTETASVWSFPGAYDVAARDCADRATPLGAHQARANALVAGIAGLPAPDDYQGVSNDSDWTHMGDMSWNVNYTQHERLDLLASDVS